MKDRLKLAMEQFYLGLHLDQPMLSDLEFDELRAKHPETVKELFEELFQDFEPSSLEQDGIMPLEKKQIKDNDLRSAVELDYACSPEYYCTPKYDGSSIRAYYRNGVLLRVMGSPDGEMGIDRTYSMWNLFPHEIEIKEPVSLVGEVLVDYDVYGELARNKANGLVNSKLKSYEVESECFIRIYRVEHEDRKFNFHRLRADLSSLPTITRARIREGSELERLDNIFDATIHFDIDSDRFPTTSKIRESGINEDIQFQCDGVVVYSENGIQGYKFYFTESAVTKVTGIDWKVQSNGGFAPTLQIEEITLNDKTIRRVSPNGVPNMMDMGLGVGAKVRVILANSTIPKVLEVLKESEDYQFPQCECGYQLTADDLFASTLKCSGDSCTAKMKNWVPQVRQWIKDETQFTSHETMRQCIVYHPEWFAYLLFIDRWDPYEKVKVEKVDSTELLTAAELGNSKIYRQWMLNNFHLTDLQISIMDANINTSIDILNGLVDRSYIDILEGRDDLSDLLY